MDRREASTLIASYVDGELSEESAREFEVYLNRDRECSYEVEALKDFREGFKNAITLFEAPPYLRTRIEHLASTSNAQSQWWPRLNRRVVWATAVVVVVGLATPFFWGNTPRLSLFVLDHLEYSEPGFGLEHATKDAEDLSDWFSNRLSFFPRIPILGARLEGGRRCHVGEEPVALAFYQVEGRRVSLFVAPEGSLHLRNFFLAKMFENSKMRYEKERGHTVATWSEAGLTYVLVSSLEETTVRTLLEDRRNESESS